MKKQALLFTLISAVNNIFKPLDRGLTYAEGCFETFGILNGRVFAWDAHMCRLAVGLAAFDISLPDTQYLWQLCLQAKNEYIQSNCLLRLTITGGNAVWGLQRKAKQQANVFVQTAPLPSPTVIHLCSPEWPFPLYKRPAKFTADYALTLRALHILSLPKPLLPLVCDNSDVYSGITANVVLYVQNEWLTPELGSGVLSGIMRQTLLDNRIVRASKIPRQLLLEATSIVLINCGVGAQICASIDGRRLIVKNNENHKLLALVNSFLHCSDSPNIR
ncbi:MAG: aminotransferase class IV [Mariprofundales bacterium]